MNPTGWETYEHPKLKWQLQYPEHWVISPLRFAWQQGKDTPDAPWTDLGSPSGHESVRVSRTTDFLDTREWVKDAHSYADLSLYIEATHTEGKSVIQVTSSGDVLVDGHAGYLVESLRYDGDNILHRLSLFVVVGRDAYSIEVEGDPEGWDAFQPHAYRIVRSFRPAINPPQPKAVNSTICTLTEGINISDVVGRIRSPEGYLTPYNHIEVVGTVTNSCDHPIDAEISARAFDQTGRLIASEREFTQARHNYWLPHPIPVLHLLPGQHAEVRFLLYRRDVEASDIDSVDITVAGVTGKP